ncbi:MAG TPA: hypothetical protein VGE98_12010, partial [Thermoanaerobaculia bacterium]
MNPTAARHALLPALVAAAGLFVIWWLHIPVLSPLALLACAGIGLLLFLWMLFRVYQGFLWRVGRRLAFSYFLLGVLPIPMVLLLFAAGAYLVSGFFLSHLYRDAQRGLTAEIEGAARGRALALAQSGGAMLPAGGS